MIAAAKLVLGSATNWGLARLVVFHGCVLLVSVSLVRPQGWGRRMRYESNSLLANRAASIRGAVRDLFAEHQSRKGHLSAARLWGEQQCSYTSLSIRSHVIRLLTMVL